MQILWPENCHYFYVSNSNVINEYNSDMKVPLPKLKALIVDDETDICYLLGSILKQKNILSVFAGSLSAVDKALEIEQDFSFVFLDNHLSDGLGLTYINRLKTELPESCLIMITAHDTNSNREKAMRQGADFFLGKPFSKDAIFKTIDAVKR